MRQTFTFLSTLCLLCIAFPVCGEEKTPTHWSIRFAVASEGTGKEISVPKEIECAHAALEKLAQKSKFRAFNLVKDATLTASATAPLQVNFNSNLAFSFRLVAKGEKKFLQATWLKREEDKPDAPLTQIGGKVNRPFSPDQSLVVLGPAVKEGVAMAVLHLVRREE